MQLLEEKHTDLASFYNATWKGALSDQFKHTSAVQDYCWGLIIAEMHASKSNLNPMKGVQKTDSKADSSFFLLDTERASCRIFQVLSPLL